MWTRKDIDDKLNQLRPTDNLWPRNPIPLRAKLKHYCKHKNIIYPSQQPCARCDARDPIKIWGAPCKFWEGAMYRPIVSVWQLEYLIPIEILHLSNFLLVGEWLYGAY